MPDESDPKQRFAEPFIPAGPIEVKGRQVVKPGDQLPPSPETRMAHALEYIAAQIGDMNRKLDRLIEAIALPKRPDKP